MTKSYDFDRQLYKWMLLNATRVGNGKATSLGWEISPEFRTQVYIGKAGKTRVWNDTMRSCKPQTWNRTEGGFREAIYRR